MYPRMLYGNENRPYQLFNHNGFLRDLPQVSVGDNISESLALAFNLKATLDRIYGLMCMMLPHDCPFIIGGGFVRDGLLGAPICDIDVWMPENIHQSSQLNSTDVDSASMCRILDAYFPNNNPASVLFTAPFATLNADTEGNAYHDMSNHWVVSHTIGGYPVQFMRTNIIWDNNPSEFMNSLCRNFDIDLCMMFLCVQRGSFSVDSCTSTEYIIMPTEIPEYLINNGTQLDTLLWNSSRDTTSEARKLARFQKMCNKYNVREVSPYTLMDSIPADSIIATPVPLRFLMEHMNRLPYPRLDEVVDNNVQTGDYNVQETGQVLQAQAQGFDWDTLRLDNGEDNT